MMRRGGLTESMIEETQFVKRLVDQGELHEHELQT